jgi:hypothetical protein
MELCLSCYTQGYCRRLFARIVSDAELKDRNFVCDVRAHASKMKILPDQWRSFLIDTYRDYPGTILDEEGKAMWLKMSVFDDPNIRYWFRDTLCIPCRPGVIPRMREESVERMRVTATILRAIDPVGASLWGLRPANDEMPPDFPTMRLAADCPYPRLLYSRQWRKRREANSS